MHRGEMDLLHILYNDFVVQELTEELLQTCRPGSGSNGGIAIGELMDLIEDLGPFSSIRRMPEAVGIGHRSTAFCDRKERGGIVEQRQILIDHDPGINEAKARQPYAHMTDRNSSLTGFWLPAVATRATVPLSRRLHRFEACSFDELLGYRSVVAWRNTSLAGPWRCPSATCRRSMQPEQ